MQMQHGVSVTNGQFLAVSVDGNDVNRARCRDAENDCNEPEMAAFVVGGFAVAVWARMS